ncbi:hypothetical protein CEUSTIGMA_g4159.t1 [Chlamydomonas eustigma]|uniref:Uncharacterized protein n=1 Tax=Chlamydomonas eustigma TaxID=1157962 RepID=A0A250X0W0_9CHLO|nr:hypothetical protein CEUSTIGMA_g4159.t1 [Chlamydomonas eustigma]|eukprot:GAX76713.1 hypothetical protein CEUSTIGMA_g4159.t1 [Chlamydomonas eustigma]
MSTNKSVPLEQLGQVEDPTLERSFRGHRDAVTSVCFNSNMKQLITGSLDNCVMVWNFKPQLRAFRFTGHKAGVYSVAFSPSHSLIASGSKDRSVRLWHPTVEGKSTVLKAHTGTVRCVNFSNDGRMLITGADDKTVKVWSLPTQRFAFTLSGHQNWVRSCQFSADGRLAVSGGDDKSVKVWDLASKRVVRSYDDHTGLVNTVAFHPDGTCIASAGTDCTIKLWDVRTNQLLQHYKAHTGAVTNLSFHPSGNFLMSTSLDTTLKIWDLREGQLFYTLHGHEGATLAASFSPAGDYFASGGADEQVMVWKTNFDRFLENYVAPVAFRSTSTTPPPPPPDAYQLAQISTSNLPRPDNSSTAAVGNPQNSTLTFPIAPRHPSPARAVQQSQRELSTALPAASSSTQYASTSELRHNPAPASSARRHHTAVEITDVKAHPHFDYEMEVPPPLNLSDLPDSLSATLQHIVGQLDVLTQTMALLDERLTMNEDRVKAIGDRIDDKLQGGATSASDVRVVRGVGDQDQR